MTIPLYKKSQAQVLKEWRTARAKHFIRLNEEKKMSFDKIAKKYGITRQAVGQLLSNYRNSLTVKAG